MSLLSFVDLSSIYTHYCLLSPPCFEFFFLEIEGLEDLGVIGDVEVVV